MESLRVCAETGTFEGNKQGETGDDDTHDNHPGAQKPKLGQTDVDKYFHLQENTIMHEIDPQTGSDMRLDTQRNIIRQSLDDNRQRHRHGNARCRPDLPTLHHRSELWGRACDHCQSPRSVG